MEQDKSALPISDNVNVHCAHHPVNGKRKNKRENLPKIKREKMFLAFPILSYILNFVLNCANGEVKN